MSSLQLGALLLAMFLGYALFEYALGRLIAKALRSVLGAIRAQYWKANGK